MKKTKLIATLAVVTGLPCLVAQPVITRQPADVAVNVGDTAVFTVSAPGATGYQWYFNDALINTNLNPSARTWRLSLTNVTFADAGLYFVVASNETGSATSQVARLTVTIAWFEAVDMRKAGITNESPYSWSAAWGDYDGDGFVDLYVANCAGWTSPNRNFFYRNNGNGTFTRKFAAEVGPPASDVDPTGGCAWADINNDGLLDLVSENTVESSSAASILSRVYINKGDGSFVKGDAGEYTKPLRTGFGCLADYDGDGWLDFFTCNASPSFTGQYTNVLFHGIGGGMFARVTSGPVVTNETTSWGVNDAAWGDFDNDGDPDLFVAGDPPWFYRNDGNGQFTRMTGSILEDRSYGLWNPAWADYDNDGFLDLAIGGAVVYLFRNNQNGDFEHVTTWELNVREAPKPTWADYDNDGYQDMIIFNGQGTADVIWLYRNNGDGTFMLITERAFKKSDNWVKGAWGDYDNDGFMDVWVNHRGGQNALFHNVGRANGNLNHWIKFKLTGRASNGAAIGAKVRVRATINGKSFWQMREISGGQWCQNDLRPNFGLGDATKVEVARIEWPSGIVQELYDLAADQIVSVTEHQDIPPGVPKPQLSVSKVPGAPAKLTLTGQAHLLYVLETSTDLVNWAMLGVGKNETGTVEYTDELYATDAQRFYRAVAP